MMKRLMILLALCSSFCVSKGATICFDEYDVAEFPYDVCVDNVHYVYNLVFSQIRNSEQIKEYYDCTLAAIWHDPGVDIPEVLTIPEKVHIKYPICNLDIVADVQVKAELLPSYNLDYSDECISFNTIRIAKNLKLINALDLRGNGITFVKVRAKAFDIEEGNPYGNFANDGVWLREYTDDSGENHSYVFYFPLNADWINYTYPAFLNDNVSYCYGNPWDVRIVSYFSEGIGDIKNIDCCPFWGIELPETMKYKCFDTAYVNRYGIVKNNNLKAFGNCSMKLGKQIIAARVPKSLENIDFKDLYDIYNVIEQKSDLKYIEFSSRCLPNVYRPADDYDLPEKAAEELAGERKVITYVIPELVDGFRELQKNKLFPVNAEIVPVEDKLYVYPEIDNGRWSKGKTQLVYAVCRFGNAEISDVKWETNNEGISHIDADGVLTVDSEGEVEVTCTITDTMGAEYKATKRIKVTDAELTSVRETLDVPKMLSSFPGVYNLYGMKVADTPDNLPVGIYIFNGKKIAVK